MAETTIGQYYPKNSIVHKLDPRVKLFGTLVYTVSLFLIRQMMDFVFVFLCLMIVVALSKIPFLKIIKGIRGIIFIVLFGMIFNLFFIKEGQILFEYRFLKITDTGLYTSLFVAIRLVLLVMGTSIMTLATTPTDLCDGLEKSFSPLKKIRVPVHEIAMIMSLSLRFIPMLMDESERIVKAQKARGADFGGRNVFKRVAAYIPVIVPLFVSAMNRAVDLATAMEARCYSGGNRTKLHPLKYKRTDYIAYAVIVLYLVVIVVLSRP